MGRVGPKTRFKKLNKGVGEWADGIAISGVRGAGKSLLVNHAMVDFAAQGHEVIKLDMENPRRRILEVMLHIFVGSVWETGIPTWHQLREYPKWLGDVKLNRYWHERIGQRMWIVDSAYEKKLTPEHIDELVQDRWEQLKPDEKQVILVIDSIDVLNNKFRLASTEYDSQQKWLAEIQSIGMKYEIPIILISHMGKGGPFKGTTAIQHWARTQILLEKDDPESAEVLVKILRAQYGEEGQLKMEIDKLRLRMREMVVTIP